MQVEIPHFCQTIPKLNFNHVARLKIGSKFCDLDGRDLDHLRSKSCRKTEMQRACLSIG